MQDPIILTAAVADGLDETLQPYRFNGKESQSFAGLPYLDYSARFYHPQSTRWTTMDPLAEKYYFLSPYAYCSGNPVNFVDPDGRFVFALPLVPYAVAAVAATATVAFGAHVVHKTSRDLSGWKHQQRQDRKAKQELDQAQANVQKSINENFPDPDSYDPNDGPNFRNDKHKGKSLFMGILAIMDQNSPIVKGLLLLSDNNNSTEEENNNQKKDEQSSPGQDAVENTTDVQDDENKNDI